MSDWDSVTVLRKKAPKSSTLKTESAVNQARRQGVAVDTQQKYGAGTNKQHVTTKNTAKLDRETEELRHDKIPLDVGKLIQQGRQGKGLSQKDLATKICEKQQVVTDYEAGRGIPNNLILGKMERVLGIKLRGKERGQPIAPPANSTTKPTSAPQQQQQQHRHREQHHQQESGGWSTVSGRRK
ncbi:endothelial differentiation-related factor 1 homolog isoform X1 [Drosophila kikkawai]|uniref:Endothelial differentiation-related factor 1 homolog isoform X1 n=1 Tax=Drosophila kikkawai TaxID=30033 RepID=A0A6P4ILH4_DROKI|nr:endothelial differentiation-related factor 1 homolog [Drosophila kikkawai]